MPASHSLPFGVSSLITLSASSLLVPIIVVVKLASLIPLLLRWNFPLLEIPQGSSHEINDISEPIARIGKKRIVIGEPSLIEKVLAAAQSKNDVESPLRHEFCNILDQAENEMQEGLKRWRLSTKKMDRESVLDGLRLHLSQEKHAIYGLWSCTKMDAWTTELVQSILGDTRARKFLQEEIANSGLNHHEYESVEDRILQTLPFLQACILEALRVHPPLHLLDTQLTIDDELSLWAYRIPTGTSVILNYNACLNAACFGLMVHALQPERWMIDDLDQLMKMRRHVSIVWGKSASQRLTVDVACMRLRKIVFSMLQQSE